MNDPNYQLPARSTNTAPRPSVSFEVATEQQPQQLSSASSYADLNFLFGVQDPAMLVTKPNRNRRKPNQGPDHTKHRRTRSGCYTCRSRRVKCDETHPICERCRKGGRDCIYPDTSSSKASAARTKRTQASNHESPVSSSDDDERVDAIPDEDETLERTTNSSDVSKIGPRGSSVSQSSSGQKSATRLSSEAPSLVQDKGASPTPSSEGSVGYPSYQTIGDWRSKKPSVSSSSTSERTDWTHLPADVQLYLAYFYENITYLHYSMKSDPDDFIRTQFLDAALENEALLYAIVGFSAFQRTLLNPEGKIQDFLQYYNKAVSLLLRSLKKGERHNNGTLLAMLQLATIEEFLGDWINLLGHQKAAYQILTQLYTPQTVMQTGMSRMILSWYIRFDVFAGLMGGFETVLSREWFSSAYEFFEHKSRSESTSLKWKVEAALALHRRLATDMSQLFAKMGKGELSIEQFMSQNEEISRKIRVSKSERDPALQDKRFTVTDFSDAQPRDPNDIVDPYIPGVIYTGPLVAMNIASMDWLSIDLMHKYQTTLTLRAEPGAELQKVAYEICQLYEALEYWPGSPPGTIMACQASLAIAVLFLPRDDRHSMWARGKLARIESHGYIYPYTFRTKMADLFRDRSCMHWWLPNDENYPPIVRSIRKFVEDRTAPAKDASTEGLRDIKSIFASLNLDQHESSVPPTLRKESPSNVAFASEGTGNLHGMDGRFWENDNYGFDYDDGQSYWDQGADAYGPPK